MAIETSTDPAAREPTAAQTARERRNSRYGLALFAIYLVLYGGFMALSIVAPGAMKETVLLGINLAVVFGFGLIIAALALAIVYMVLCRHTEGEER